MISLTFLIGGTTAFAGYYFFNKVNVNETSIIAIIVDIGAVLLLGGTLLSQITRPGYLAKQMIDAEMKLAFSEWVVLLVCFIIKCSCIFLAIRYSKNYFTVYQSRSLHLLRIQQNVSI